MRRSDDADRYEQKSLRRLNKKDLLTVLYTQQQKIEKLEETVAALEERLADRSLEISEMGSIAEAALKLNSVFEAAQKAADQYVENARIRAQIEEQQ